MFKQDSLSHKLHVASFIKACVTNKLPSAGSDNFLAKCSLQKTDARPDGDYLKTNFKCPQSTSREVH